MTYKLIQGQDPFELNPGLRAVKEYDILEPRQMFFVLLVCDTARDSPIKTLSGKARRESAAKIAGYHLEADGKRLDKNGRDTVAGKKVTVEAAIEKFKELHYNTVQHSIEALRKQIAEIQDFLESDKRTPLTNRAGEIIKNDKGEDVWITSEKSLKFALEAAPKLPDLHEALARLEAQNNTEDTKFSGTSYTAYDLEVDEDSNEEDLPAIERFHANATSNTE